MRKPDITPQKTLTVDRANEKAYMARKLDEMHDHNRQKKMHSSVDLRERIARNAPAVAEKVRRRAVRRAWKREELNDFNAIKTEDWKIAIKTLQVDISLTNREATIKKEL